MLWAVDGSGLVPDGAVPAVPGWVPDGFLVGEALPAACGRGFYIQIGSAPSFLVSTPVRI